MQKKTILLYNPKTDFYTMPLALIALASNVEHRQFNVKIIDARVNHSAHQELMASLDQALCVGITVLTGRPIHDALDISRKIKQQKPDIPVIWGGWHTSLFGKETLEEKSIDITVQGQGEKTFSELTQRIDSGHSLEGLSGICWRDGEIIKENPKRALIALDDFNSPDYSLINVERFFKLKDQRQLDYISSIGCPFRCAFCADPFVYEQKWKGESSQRVADNLQQLWQTYGFQDVNFQDETFFVYRNRVTELAEALLARQLPISWAATLRADQGKRMPDDVWSLCKESGLRRVLIGVESGSPSMIKQITKDTTLDQIFYCAEQCLKYDLAAIYSIIVGFPGETEEQVQATLNIAQRLRSMSPKFSTPIFYFKPYPGSRIAFDLDVDLPTSLEQWGDFDYVDGPKNQWITERSHKKVQAFKRLANAA